jgi:hypothetical protein
LRRGPRQVRVPVPTRAQGGGNAAGSIRERPRQSSGDVTEHHHAGQPRAPRAALRRTTTFSMPCAGPDLHARSEFPAHPRASGSPCPLRGRPFIAAPERRRVRLSSSGTGVHTVNGSSGASPSSSNHGNAIPDGAWVTPLGTNGPTLTDPTGTTGTAGTLPRLAGSGRPDAASPDPDRPEDRPEAAPPGTDRPRSARPPHAASPRTQPALGSGGLDRGTTRTGGRGSAVLVGAASFAAPPPCAPPSPHAAGPAGRTGRPRCPFQHGSPSLHGSPSRHGSTSRHRSRPWFHFPPQQGC